MKKRVVLLVLFLIFGVIYLIHYIGLKSFEKTLNEEKLIDKILLTSFINSNIDPLKTRVDYLDEVQLSQFQYSFLLMSLSIEVTTNKDGNVLFPELMWQLVEEGKLKYEVDDCKFSLLSSGEDNSWMFSSKEIEQIRECQDFTIYLKGDDIAITNIVYDKVKSHLFDDLKIVRL